MGSLAIQSPVTAPPVDGSLTRRGDGSSRPIPELSEASYLLEVFSISTQLSEDQMDQELASIAASLGIAVLPRPSASEQEDQREGCPSGSQASAGRNGPNTNSSASATAALTLHPQSPTVATAFDAEFPSLRASPPTPATVVNPLSPVATIVSSPSQAIPLLRLADSPGPHVARRRSRNLSFSQYDKYLAQLDPNLKQPKFLDKDTPAPVHSTASLFSVSTRKSFISITRSIKSKVRWKRLTPAPPPFPFSCVCCRDDFSKIQSLHTLPCGHTYCSGCLKIMVTQSSTDESKMPPRCCTQPIPGTIIKGVLSREDQQAFLKAVLQFSTPWETRIFCPNPVCGEFIRPRSKIDPKHPFDISCRQCRSRACVMCKRAAHPLGQDCPADWELEAVLKMGERSGWRRCYKCRSLVELSQGCTHITCRCKAQFCYICGAVWDGAVGCPNYCNGEEELERRRLAEEARMAELEAEKEAAEKAAIAAEAERQAAAARTAESVEFGRLKSEMEAELARFVAFERKTRWVVWSRHTQERLVLREKFADQIEKMRERHAKTTQHLEDRQIAAEMDLQATLEQRARSVKIRLRHMEAYCDGLGRNSLPPGAVGCTPGSRTESSGSSSGMPARVVTERDLRELGQQYNMRDDLERLHQARINVLRDKQAKNMEELQERHQSEMERLINRRDEEVEDLEAGFAAEDDALIRVFTERRERLQARWQLMNQILQREMEDKTGLKHGPTPLPEWPRSSSAEAGG